MALPRPPTSRVCESWSGEDTNSWQARAELARSSRPSRAGVNFLDLVAEVVVDSPPAQLHARRHGSGCGRGLFGDQAKFFQLFKLRQIRIYLRDNLCVTLLHQSKLDQFFAG